MDCDAVVFSLLFIYFCFLAKLIGHVTFFNLCSYDDGPRVDITGPFSGPIHTFKTHCIALLLFSAFFCIFVMQQHREALSLKWAALHPTNMPIAVSLGHFWNVHFGAFSMGYVWMGPKMHAASTNSIVQGDRLIVVWKRELISQMHRHFSLFPLTYDNCRFMFSLLCLDLCVGFFVKGKCLMCIQNEFRTPIIN